VVSSLNLLLVGNSLLTILLIFNQNDSRSTKDGITNRNTTSSTNPLEIITWGCLIFQLILLLMKAKNNDF
jgi:hypothetical protein